VQVINFYRSELRYAIYKEGWILYDNTGLKGVAADWARDVLGSKNLPPDLRRVNLKEDKRSEQEIYDAELRNCTHLVSAIGYDTNPLPTIKVDGEEVKPDFDPLTGRFFRTKGEKTVLPGLFGAGIAYPERVTDPEKNVEAAVGWFKVSLLKDFSTERIITDDFLVHEIRSTCIARMGGTSLRFRRAHSHYLLEGTNPVSWREVRQYMPFEVVPLYHGSRRLASCTCVVRPHEATLPFSRRSTTSHEHSRSSQPQWRSTRTTYGSDACADTYQQAARC